MLPIPRGLFGVPGMLGTKQPGTPPEGMRLDPGFGAKPTTPQQRRGLFGGRLPFTAGDLFSVVLNGTAGLQERREQGLTARAEEQEAKTQEERRAEAERLFPNNQRAQMLYISGNEEFLNALADQFRPQVIAAGGQQSIAGEDRVIGTPSFQEFGDSIVRQDPTTGGVSIAAQRGPTYGEQTQRLTATQETLSPGQVIVDTQTGQQIGQGRNRVFAAGDGVQLYDEQGQPIAENVRDPAASSPQDAERRQRAAQAEAERLGSIRQAIGRAREQIGFWTTGPLSGLSRIGGTPAADLAATLDTIEANLSFDALADMRAASPTGGALGSITERELQLLGSTVASLRQSQSPEQLRRNLEIIEQTLGAVESRAGQQPQQPQQPRRRRYNPATGEFE